MKTNKIPFIIAIITYLILSFFSKKFIWLDTNLLINDIVINIVLLFFTLISFHISKYCLDILFSNKR